MVCDILPSRIVRPGKPIINITKYRHKMPCIYSRVIDMTRDLLSRPKPNLILHMGMRGRSQATAYAFERTARRDVYARPGLDGEYFPAEILAEGGAWCGAP